MHASVSRLVCLGSYSKVYMLGYLATQTFPNLKPGTGKAAFSEVFLLVQRAPIQLYLQAVTR